MSQTSNELQNLLLLWDVNFLAHQRFNKALVGCLSADKPLSILYFGDYLSQKHFCLSQTRFDWQTMQPHHSKRKAAILNVKRLVKLISGRQVTADIRYLEQANIKSIAADEFLESKLKQELRRRILRMSSKEIYSLSYRNYPISQHFCVDMSLDCKTTGIELAANSPELCNLRLLSFHASLMVEALHRFFQLQPCQQYRVLSTSVYSLDWICRGFSLERGHQHLFLEQVPNHVQGCKVYTTYSHDLLLRRQHQSGLVYSREHLVEAIEYAEAYLTKRLSPRSAHTYSPLESSVGELSKLAKLLTRYPDSDLWIYFTNSPDELVSISHDCQCADLKSDMAWDDAGVAQNELEALRLIARMAHQQNALLVIRQHPRLGPEMRSSFLSNEYHSIANCCIELERLYPDRVISFEPWSPINSYELALIADRVISFRGTMPLEVSLLGLRPLVLAVNKGYMNYAIKMHSQAAPRCFDDLSADLANNTTCYAFDELATFLVQFYLARGIGVIPLNPLPESRKGLAHALHMRTSILSKTIIPGRSECRLLEALSQSSSPDEGITRHPLAHQGSELSSWAKEMNDLIVAYLDSAYKTAGSRFQLL